MRGWKARLQRRRSRNFGQGGSNAHLSRGLWRSFARANKAITKYEARNGRRARLVSGSWRKVKGKRRVQGAFEYLIKTGQVRFQFVVQQQLASHQVETGGASTVTMLDGCQASSPQVFSSINSICLIEFVFDQFCWSFFNRFCFSVHAAGPWRLAGSEWRWGWTELSATEAFAYLGSCASPSVPSANALSVKVRLVVGI